MFTSLASLKNQVPLNTALYEMRVMGGTYDDDLEMAERWWWACIDYLNYELGATIPATYGVAFTSQQTESDESYEFYQISAYVEAFDAETQEKLVLSTLRVLHLLIEVFYLDAHNKEEQD